MASVTRAAKAAATFVTTLPSSPTDGQEVFYQSTTAGTGGGASNSMADVGAVWHLRYRSASASAYKWESVGGPRLNHSVQDGDVFSGESTSSATYVALTTAGPRITLPLAGDYEISLGFTGYGGTAGAVSTMSYDIGGTGAVDADACQIYQSTAVNIVTVPSRVRVKTGLTAVTLTAKYKSSSGTANYWNRTMSVAPIRVG